jgi:hypothetical protein
MLGLATVASLLLAGAVTVPEGASGIGTSSARADLIGFCNIYIGPGGRCVGPYAYLYGVGYTTVYWQTDGNDVCIGAKTNADGSGGNAIPFTCMNVPADQTRWTPGGQSNWGYPTIINQEARNSTGGGSANIRPF